MCFFKLGGSSKGPGVIRPENPGLLIFSVVFFGAKAIEAWSCLINL